MTTSGPCVRAVAPKHAGCEAAQSDFGGSGYLSSRPTTACANAEDSPPDTRCPECGSDALEGDEFDFGICPETGYHDAGQTYRCLDCGATGEE